MRIAALAGGVGGAKFLLGLTHAMDPKDITIIANTGDDIVVHGLMVSPDPDIITYTLGGVVNPETGWGFAGESFTGSRDNQVLGTLVPQLPERRAPHADDGNFIFNTLHRLLPQNQQLKS